MATTSIGTLRRMQDVASRLWGPGRRWTPGEIAWDLLTGTDDDQEVRFFGDGWAWRHGNYVVILADNPASIVQGLSHWAPEPRVQASDGDVALRAALDREGYREVVSAPFDLDMRLPTAAALPVRPGGYLVRSADEGDDLLGVHRAAWRPADLPFAPGHAPPVDPEATSSLTASALAAVQAAWPYRRDLHVVAEAEDGRLAASCIAWLDPATGVAAIEPLGVHPDHRRRGLAGALCLHAARLVAAAGGREVVIHPRGDAAYPAPRGAYRRCGFAEMARTRVYARS